VIGDGAPAGGDPVSKVLAAGVVTGEDEVGAGADAQVGQVVEDLGCGDRVGEPENEEAGFVGGQPCTGVFEVFAVAAAGPIEVMTDPQGGEQVLSDRPGVPGRPGGEGNDPDLARST
jgi:hypothetical protein